MNRVRKHQLEQNQLANQIEHGLEAARPVLPFILLAIVVAVIGSVAWSLYSGSVKRKRAEAWTEFYFNLLGGDAETFQDVADRFPESTMSGWARQAAADQFLGTGLEALYINRSEAKKSLDLAIQTYEEIEQSALTPELRSKALLGLAQAHESLGNLDEANKYYEQFTAASTQPQLISAANERLAFINSSAGKSFYDWFSKLDPKPDAPIELPADLNLPPMIPDLDFGSPSSGSSSISIPPVTEIDPAGLPQLDLSPPEPPAAGSPGDIGSLELPASDEPSSAATSSSSEPAAEETDSDDNESTPDNS